MSRPTIPSCIPQACRRTAGSWLAPLGLFLLLIAQGTALGADPPQDKPADKKPAEKPAPAPRRFTDEDLEKYHKPKPADEEAAAENPAAEPAPAGAAAPVPPAAAPSPAAPKPSPAKPRASKIRMPQKAGPPPEDPLKAWKDREDLESLRSKQIADVRERIAALQSRLDYLEQKRLAVVDPLRIMPQPRTPEEAAEDATRKPRELLEAVEAEIESVKGEIGQAKSELIRIETRFEQETAAR